MKGIGKRSTVGPLGENTAFNGANCPGLLIDSKVQDVERIFFTVYALLNSKVVSYYLNQICPPKLGGYFRYNANNINNIPLPDELINYSTEFKNIINNKRNR